MDVDNVELLYSLLQNLFMLISIVGIGSYYIIKIPRKYSSIAWGLLFGVATISMMLTRIEVTTGYFMDFRNVTLTLAGIAGGPIGALIATIFSSLFRIFQGGAGLIPGITSCVIYAVIGVTLHCYIENRLIRNGYLLVLGFGLAGVALTLLMFLPPWNHPFTIIAAKNLATPMLIFNPIAMLVSYRLYILTQTHVPQILLLENLLKTNHLLFATMNSQEKFTYISRPLQENPYYETMSLRLMSISKKVLQLGENCNEEFVVTQFEKTYYYLMKAVPYHGVHLEEGVIIIISDITPQREIEQYMARMDRLDIVGQMAASVAHEVRNPMTAARGFVQLIAKRSPEHCGQLAIVIEELDRANNIISNFLAIARDRAVEKEKCSINDIILSILPIIEADGLKRDIMTKVNLDAIIPEHPYNVEEIKQLIYNLVLNGFDAMQQVAVKELTICTSYSTKEITLIIKDTGCGINESQKQKLFEPFFTTKKEGTGLGLTVCNSIVERHEGRIGVKSETGAGTEFIVRFREAI